jgi:catechol 2,3-dioxygenase-like lactoylglutathione lyase family enzyme
MPALNGVVETAMYVQDMNRAEKFYEEILGLRRVGGADDRFRAYDVAGRSILLLFQQGTTSEPLRLPGGVIPPHDGSGHNHFAFAIAKSELENWERHLAQYQVGIEGRMQWPLGGVSVYFRDPDGNLLELATPGVWSSY